MAETVETAKDLMRYYMEKDIPSLTTGAPGVGKSEAWQQLAEEKKIGFIDLRLAQMDPVDLRGLPSVLRDNKNIMMTTWARPDFWPVVERDGERGILLLDEIPDSGKAMQSAAYQVVLNKRAGPHVIPKGWYIAAAGNDQKHRAGAQVMSTALASRFAHIEIEADVECFLKHGAKVGFHHYVLGFIKWRPTLLHDMKSASGEKAFPTPRTWSMVSKVCDAPREIVSKLVRGCVGSGAAGEFETFLRTIDLPTMEEICKNPDKCRIPNEPGHRYAICFMVAQYAERQNFDKVMRYIKRKEFGRDFEILSVLEASKRDSSLTETKTFVEFANRNSDLTL